MSDDGNGLRRSTRLKRKAPSQTPDTTNTFFGGAAAEAGRRAHSGTHRFQAPRDFADFISGVAGDRPAACGMTSFELATQIRDTFKYVPTINSSDGWSRGRTPLTRRELRRRARAFDREEKRLQATLCGSGKRYRTAEEIPFEVDFAMQSALVEAYGIGACDDHGAAGFIRSAATPNSFVMTVQSDAHTALAVMGRDLEPYLVDTWNAVPIVKPVSEASLADLLLDDGPVTLSGVVTGPAPRELTQGFEARPLDVAVGPGSGDETPGPREEGFLAELGEGETVPLDD